MKKIEILGREGVGLRAIHQESWNRVKPLAIDLLEDFYKLVLMLLFVGLCAVLVMFTVNVITVIVGDTPTIVMFIQYAADAAFIIKYYPYLFNNLKMPDQIAGKRITAHSTQPAYLIESGRIIS